jgi:mercuric reductase
MKNDYDLLVIGSGSAGFSAAEAARGTGRKIGLVEADKLGGECPNYACVPTKVLLRSAKAFLSLKGMKELGIDVGQPKISFEQVMKRRAKIVDGLGGKRMLKVAEQLGLDVIKGHATFIDQNTVHVGGKEVSASNFIIATGTTTRVPNIPGIDDISWLSYKHAVNLEEQPKSMIIVGAGPVGCEFATFYATVGTKVTLLQAEKNILNREEPEISEIAQKRLEALGVDVRTSVEVIRVGRLDNEIVATVRVGRELKSVDAEQLLLATGKSSNTGGLGCDAAGVKLDKFGTIITNSELRTSAKHIWAAGDVDGGMQFTHTAHYEGSLAGRNAFSKKPDRVDERVVPRVTFVEPEVASVGMTEAQAKETTGGALVGVFDLRGLGRGYLDGHREGLLKIVADRKTRKVIGGHMIGERAGEVVHEIALAMYAKLKVDDLASMIHAYPTYSEAVTAAANIALSDV